MPLGAGALEGYPRGRDGRIPPIARQQAPRRPAPLAVHRTEADAVRSRVRSQRHRQRISGLERVDGLGVAFGLPEAHGEEHRALVPEARRRGDAHDALIAVERDFAHQALTGRGVELRLGGVDAEPIGEERLDARARDRHWLEAAPPVALDRERARGRATLRAERQPIHLGPQVEAPPLAGEHLDGALDGGGRMAAAPDRVRRIRLKRVLVADARVGGAVVELDARLVDDAVRCEARARFRLGERRGAAHVLDEREHLRGAEGEHHATADTRGESCARDTCDKMGGGGGGLASGQCERANASGQTMGAETRMGQHTNR